MSETQLGAITTIRQILDIYDVPERRILAYTDFYSRDIKMLSHCDPEVLAMILSAYEGGCENPPSDCPKTASIAAWGYTNINSVPSFTVREFISGISELSRDLNADLANSTVFNRETVVSLARGFYFLSEGLEAGETDLKLAKALGALSLLMETLMERADLGYNESSDGTVAIGDTVSDWLMDNTQCVIDYATVLLTYRGLNVKTFEDLESGIETLNPAYIEFVDDLN